LQPPFLPRSHTIHPSAGTSRRSGQLHAYLIPPLESLLSIPLAFAASPGKNDSRLKPIDYRSGGGSRLAALFQAAAVTLMN